MSAPKGKILFIAGPIGLSADDGYTRVDYLKMRAIALREIQNMAKDGPVTIIVTGTPWSGYIGIDLMPKLKNSDVRLKFEMSSRFDEIHTPDRKMWDGRFDGSIDGSRLNSAHMGFRRITGIQCLKNMFEKKQLSQSTTHQSIAAAHRIVIKSADTVIVFPTSDPAMREIIEEFKDRNKDVREFTPKQMNAESIVPKERRLMILSRALSVLKENQGDIMDHVRGDIFVEALEVLKIASAIKRSKELSIK